MSVYNFQRISASPCHVSPLMVQRPSEQVIQTFRSLNNPRNYAQHVDKGSFIYLESTNIGCT